MGHAVSPEHVTRLAWKYDIGACSAQPNTNVELLTEPKTTDGTSLRLGSIFFT